jgi:hypothetical protein
MSNLSQKLVIWYKRAMVVRIRFARGPKLDPEKRKSHPIAVAVASLLTPAAVMASALALWRVAADLNWASSFAIPSGPFSYWQFWLGAAIALQGCSHLLNRYAKRGNTAIS